MAHTVKAHARARLARVARNRDRGAATPRVDGSEGDVGDRGKERARVTVAVAGVRGSDGDAGKAGGVQRGEECDILVQYVGDEGVVVLAVLSLDLQYANHSQDQSHAKHKDAGSQLDRPPTRYGCV